MISPFLNYILLWYIFLPSFTVSVFLPKISVLWYSFHKTPSLYSYFVFKDDILKVNICIIFMISLLKISYFSNAMSCYNSTMHSIFTFKQAPIFLSGEWKLSWRSILKGVISAANLYLNLICMVLLLHV